MPTDTALLVIDMQVALVEGAYQQEEVLERIASLLAEARATGTPILYIQHDHRTYAPMKPGTPGWEIHPAIAPAPGELVIRKEASDAFYATSLRAELDARGITCLVVTGMQTENCVDATCRRAISEGYAVTLVADGHTTGDSKTLSAAQIIAHHNEVLSGLPNPDQILTVVPRAAVTLVRSTAAAASGDASPSHP